MFGGVGIKAGWVLGINGGGGLMLGTHGREVGLILWVFRHRVGGGLGCSTAGMGLSISGGCGLCGVGINGLSEFFEGASFWVWVFVLVPSSV
jgi:hypothetical protein